MRLFKSILNKAGVVVSTDNFPNVTTAVKAIQNKEHTSISVSFAEGDSVTVEALKAKLAVIDSKVALCSKNRVNKSTGEIFKSYYICAPTVSTLD